MNDGPQSVAAPAGRRTGRYRPQATISHDGSHRSILQQKDLTMTQAKSGDTVKVNYTGRLDNGAVFDTTENRHPFEFVLGQVQLISGFEKAIVGMSAGETKTIKLPPEEAYGSRRDDMIVKINRDRLAADAIPMVGQTLQLQTSNGAPVTAKVTDVSESDVTVDANHPLAGQSLTFEISLLEVA